MLVHIGTSILHVHMFVLVTDYTLRKIMSANDQGIVVRGRAHCQLQVAFFHCSVARQVPGFVLTRLPPYKNLVTHGLHLKILCLFLCCLNDMYTGSDPRKHEVTRIPTGITHSVVIQWLSYQNEKVHADQNDHGTTTERVGNCTM